MRKYLSIGEEDDISWALIQAALSSVARTTIVPMQDILRLGGSARMNIPATQVKHIHRCKISPESMLVMAWGTIWLEIFKPNQHFSIDRLYIISSIFLPSNVCNEYLPLTMLCFLIQFGNWGWRIPSSTSFDCLETEAMKLRDLLSRYGRI